MPGRPRAVCGPGSVNWPHPRLNSPAANPLPSQPRGLQRGQGEHAKRGDWRSICLLCVCVNVCVHLCTCVHACLCVHTGNQGTIGGPGERHISSDNCCHWLPGTLVALGWKVPKGAQCCSLQSQQGDLSLRAPVLTRSSKRG